MNHYELLLPLVSEQALDTGKRIAENTKITFLTKSIKANDKFVMSDFSSMMIADKVYQQTIAFDYDYVEQSIKLITTNCNCHSKQPVCEHCVASIIDFLELYVEPELTKLGSTEVPVVSLEIEEQYLNQQFEDNLSYAFEHESDIEELQSDKTVSSTFNNPLVALIDKYSKAPMIRQAEAKYELIPELRIWSGSELLELKLRVGIVDGKSYVVKDVYKFAHYFKLNETTTYGTNVDIEHNTDMFANKQLVDYVLNLIAIGQGVLDNTESAITSRWYSQNPGIKYEKKTIQLDQATVVRFLSLYREPTLSVKYDGYDTAKYQLKKKSSKFILDIEKVNHQLKFSSSANKLIMLLATNTLISIDTRMRVIETTVFESSTQAEMANDILGEVGYLPYQHAYNFEYSILRKLEQYIEADFDFSTLYEDVEIDEIITEVNLERDTLRVHSYIEKHDDITFNQEKWNNLMLPTNGPLEFCSINPDSYEYTIKGINNIIDFNNQYIETLELNSDIFRANEAFTKFEVKTKLPLTTKISVQPQNALLNISSSEYDESELLLMLKAIDGGDEYFETSDYQYIDLHSQDVKQIQELCDRLDINLQKSDSLNFAYSKANTYYLSALLSKYRTVSNNDKLTEEIVNSYNNISKTKLSIPETINANLRPYQIHGVNWLNYLHKFGLGGILADDMGLGKTLQVITHLASHSWSKPILIVTPASLIYNWQSEFDKFYPTANITLIDGTAKLRKQTISSMTSNQIYITSYDLLKRDIEDYRENEYDYIILDEAQAIKNPISKAAKSVKSLIANHKLALTGTPIENNLIEMWSLFDFIIPGYLESQMKFKRRFVSKEGEVYFDDMTAKIKPFILRRLKRDVLTELPDKIEKQINVTLDNKQRKIYDAEAMRIKMMLMETNDKDYSSKRIDILAQITKLRQLACSPNLAGFDFPTHSAKELMLFELCDELIANNHKVVIFSQFTSNFEQIEPHLQKMNYKFFKITGQTPKGKRHSMVEKFNSDDTPIFLVSLKAGGVGLNITGADTVIHYDPWWNVAAESQATDRVHRMGQKNNVLVYKLISKDTIEDRVLDLQIAKKDLIDNVINQTTKQSRLTKDELLDLFD